MGIENIESIQKLKEAIEKEENIKYISFLKSRDLINEYLKKSSVAGRINVLVGASRLIDNYYSFEINQKAPKTVGYTAAFVAFEDNNCPYTKNYIYQIFRLNTKSFNDCKDQFDKLKKKHNFFGYEYYKNEDNI